MDMPIDKKGLSKAQRFQKRYFDIIFSAIGLLLVWWIIVGAVILARFSTGGSGFFKQERIGMHKKLFNVLKIRTMKVDSNILTTVTTSSDSRITRLGAFFRKTKIDELPQLWNVLIGQMSLVGPRPDVPGFADKLSGDDKIILSIRPGITGPATLSYKDEEEALSRVDNPERHNLTVIFPDKVKINKEYIKNYSLVTDIKLILNTFLK
jgi:lipopolysaccharide/colanic/teichoic acid biosynthesis glycosyltransferase